MSDLPTPYRCSHAARARADPLVGTAPPARHWLLLEHPGPWRIDAVAGSGIEASVLQALTSAAATLGTRIFLIRRPGRPQRSPQRRWLLAGLDQTTVTGTWSADSDLLAAVDALRESRSAADQPAEPSNPLVLVCAHGIHDVCCAVRGRPVAAALAERWPDRVWECSHVGGCRFAPSIVLLPDGYYYGGLDPASAVATVEAHLRGVVTPAHLRGMARFPPAGQAAAAAAYERFGPLGPRGVEVIGMEHLPPRTGQPGRTTVHLQVEGVPEQQRVELLEVRRPEAQLTCRAARATPATDYQVVNIQSEPAPPITG